MSIGGQSGLNNFLPSVDFENVFGEKSFAANQTICLCCRGLPCGVQPPEPVPGPDGDKLASIAARFSYFQEKKTPSVTANKIDLRRSINPPARYKNARPTVRLRPRQVLCSKCRSICNENSENVDASNSRKRKLEAATEQQQHQQQQQQPAVPVRRSDRRCNQPPQKNQRSLLPGYRSAAARSTPAAEKNLSSPDDSVDSSTKPSQSLAAPKISARLRPNEIDDATRSIGEPGRVYRLIVPIFIVGNLERGISDSILPTINQQIGSTCPHAIVVKWCNVRPHSSMFLPALNAENSERHITSKSLTRLAGTLRLITTDDTSVCRCTFAQIAS